MKVYFVLALVITSGTAAAAQEAKGRPGLSAVPGLASIKKLEIWGTCYFQFNCQGNAIGLGKTATECRAQGGHSLFTPNVNRCYNL